MDPFSNLLIWFWSVTTWKQDSRAGLARSVTPPRTLMNPIVVVSMPPLTPRLPPDQAESLVGRLTIQNRTFEAGGIDAVAWVAEQVRAAGDRDLADFFDSQLADEIIHVRFANEWLRRTIKEKPHELLTMGTTMMIAAKGFEQVMGKEATGGVHYPTDRLGRMEAGFTEKEVNLATELAQRAAHAR